jgi:NAD(P)-dependent dehydrogenase (short-subunit alcohol dehydrogenase family)
MTNALPKAHGTLPLAIVVGAGGMALAVARKLGERSRLLIADRDRDLLAAVAKALFTQGHQVDVATCDVTDPKAVAALAEQARRIGGLKLLAHVVGVSPAVPDGRAIMQVNLIGPTLVCDALEPMMGDGTAAVFIASIAAHLQVISPRMAAILDRPLAPGFHDAVEKEFGEKLTPQMGYAYSKWGLMQMCRRRVASWGGRGARINSLSPGLIQTPMGIESYKHSPRKYDLLAKIPLQREGNMLEIANAVDFLLSDRASYVTGTDLLVDGGSVAVDREAKMDQAQQ